MISIKMQQLFNWLNGDWIFTRSIHDKYGEIEGNALGEAVFRASGNSNILLYEESGRISLIKGNTTLNFFRKYEYNFDDDLLEINFGDGESKGSLFQKIDFSKSEISNLNQAHHLCKDDLYDGVYHFRNEQNFYTKYLIKGPKKDYSIESEFQKKLVR